MLSAPEHTEKKTSSLAMEELPSPPMSGITIEFPFSASPAFDFAVREAPDSLYPYRFCPELDTALIDDLLRVFPDEVNPRKDDNWEYVKEYGVSLVMPVPWAPKVQFPVITGVRPRGPGFLKEMGDRLGRRLRWLDPEVLQ